MASGPLIIPGLIAPSSLKDLPEKTGVYRLYDREEKLLYVGKSLNIQERIRSHFSARDSHPKEQKLFDRTAYIRWTVTGSELVALLMESAEIKSTQAPLNRAQRRTKGFWALVLRQDPLTELVYTRTEPLSLENEEHAVWTFSSRLRAFEFAREFYKEHAFCEKLLLNGAAAKLQLADKRACFFRNIDCCHGACTGEESATDFNARFFESLSQNLRLNGSFVVFDTGRKRSERSFVVVEKSSYKGYGFVPATQLAHWTLGSLQPYLQRQPDTREARRILSSFIARDNLEVCALEDSPEPLLKDIGSKLRHRLSIV